MLTVIINTFLQDSSFFTAKKKKKKKRRREKLHQGCTMDTFGIFFPKSTPGPHLMRIHLVRYSTSARYKKYSIIHLVRPIIHLVRIFELSTS